MTAPRSYITLEELERLVDVATCPAHLLETIWESGLNPDFAEQLTRLWLKDFDSDKNYVMLRKMEQNLGTGTFLS